MCTDIGADFDILWSWFHNRPRLATAHRGNVAGRGAPASEIIWVTMYVFFVRRYNNAARRAILRRFHAPAAAERPPPTADVAAAASQRSEIRQLSRKPAAALGVQYTLCYFVV